MCKEATPSPMEQLVVLLQVVNEALGLAWVLERIPYAKLEAMGYKTTVLVMDGHSTDATSTVADEYGVLFVDRVTDEAGLLKELKDHGFQREHVQSVS